MIDLIIYFVEKKLLGEYRIMESNNCLNQVQMAGITDKSVNLP